MRIWIWIWIGYISNVQFRYMIWIYIHFQFEDLDRILYPKKADLPQACLLAYWKQRNSGTDKRLKTENSRNRKQQKQKTEEAVWQMKQ